MSVKRIFLIWLLILPAMIVNGILRETFLVPRFGRVTADICSAALAILIIVGITRPFLRRIADTTIHGLARISLTWLLLTVAFEFVFGHYVDKKTWAELANNHALWKGHLWPLVLLTLVVSPFLWSRRKQSAGPN